MIAQLKKTPRAGAARKTYTFDEAIERFDRSGYMLARLETLIMAGRDKRIDRTCLEVLICLIEAMNRQSLTTFIGREAISEKCGISVKSVSNYLCQLRALGYIASAYRQTPEANNRSLLHYTLTALSPEELEEAIKRAVASLRGETSSVVALATSRQDGNSAAETSRRDGNSPDDFPSGREPTSRRDGSSNLPSLSITTEDIYAAPNGADTNTRNAKAKKTTLDPNWQPDFDWVRDRYVATEHQLARELEKFRNWHVGQGSRMADWNAAWRTWWDKDFHKIPRRAGSGWASASDDELASALRRADEIDAQCAR